MSDTQNYLVAAIHPWNRRAYEKCCSTWPGNWRLITSPDDLTAQAVKALEPRYIFFPHWSWRVPDAILDIAECVCFHMTDLPYGRGGSPLQNLIIAGHTETVVSALRMESGLDTGPIYMKRPMSLDGRAQDIYERAADIAFGMIGDIVREQPAPVPQSGEVTVFERRTPAESELPAGASIQQFYNHVRMLDADGYPRAFVDYGDLRMEFSDARQTSAGEITARVSVCRPAATTAPGKVGGKTR